MIIMQESLLKNDPKFLLTVLGGENGCLDTHILMLNLTVTIIMVPNSFRIPATYLPIVQFRIHQNRWIKIQKTHLYRVNLNLKRSGENSHPSVCCFLLLINTFPLVFVNIFLQLEAASFVFLYSGFGEFETGPLACSL